MAIQFEHKVIRTPIDTINILSAGGIKVGSICELYGPPHSGKSAFAYQVAGMTLKDDPKAEVIILDPESSVDYVRLVHTFGCDPNRVTVIPCPTLEEGFMQIGRLSNESRKDKKLRIVIWDSIAASVPAADYNSYNDEKSKGNMYSAGISLRPRVISHFIGEAMSSVATSNICVFLVNQVKAKIGVYNPSGSYGTAGGYALSHSVHYLIYFGIRQKYFDESKGINIGTSTRVNIEKSKFGATTKKINIWIDDLVGGKIIPGEEVIETCIATGVIKGYRKWWWFTCDENKPNMIKYRYNNAERLSPEDPILLDNPEVREKAIEQLTCYYRCNFFTLDKTYELAGIKLGEPTKEDRARYAGLTYESSESALTYEDGTVRVDGRYKSDDLYSMSQIDLISLFNEIASHNPSLLSHKFNESPSKRDIINLLIKHDIAVGTIADGELVTEGVKVITEDNPDEFSDA